MNAAAARQPAKTPERVLEVSLALFNEQGAPNVTTNHIADAAEISPGNLYYHFRHKEDIVMALYERYEATITAVLDGGAGRDDAIDGLWLRVHFAFEVIHDYRFFHRDLSDLTAAYPALRARFQQGLERGIARTSAYCRSLAATGALAATPAEAHALAVNITLVTIYWLNLQFLRHAGHASAPTDDDAISEGVFQVLSLVTPYLRGRMQEEFRSMALRYLPAAG